MKSLSNWIKFFFISLFFFTPLVFTFSNSELFELPKMYLVYFFTIIITCLHLINSIKNRLPLFKKTFLNIPLILFFLSQLISTIISIDPYTSFFGYYSRLNGGLLSLVSYLLLYFVLISYLDEKHKNNLITFSLISGFLVSIFAIAEHFGIDKNLWVQDVQSRVFSTLGQPNWLAAYLVILIPLSLYKFSQSIPLFQKMFYSLATFCFYLSLLFTKSKSGIIAAVISVSFYFCFILFKSLKSKTLKLNFLPFLPLILIFIISSLLIKNPIKDFLSPPKLEIKSQEISNLNITPSEDIRQIVWQGAVDLWKKYPVFGTGTETFAYSYYWTRPASHNLTSEWDFLYNKAHNEYLNFLATTGAFGLVTYLILILFSILALIKNNQKNRSVYLDIALLSSYLSILITNIAGFSVVIVSIFFFLIPAFANSDVTESKEVNKDIKVGFSRILSIILVILFHLYLISKILFFFIADISFAKSEDLDSKNDYLDAFQYLSVSLFLRPSESIYLSKSGLLSAKLAVVSASSQDKGDYEQYLKTAIDNSNQAIKISPANTNIWKERAQTFYFLSTIDSQYFEFSIDALYQITRLAPTDAKTYYLIGQFLESANLKTEAITYYQKAVDLKPNYDHAYFALGKIFFDQKNYASAKTNLELNLKYAPTNTEAQNLINKIPKK
jgi:O-antigen ligase